MHAAIYDLPDELLAVIFEEREYAERREPFGKQESRCEERRWPGRRRDPQRSTVLPPWSDQSTLCELLALVRQIGNRDCQELVLRTIQSLLKRISESGCIPIDINVELVPESRG
jgi:hypothetical protein